MQSKDEAEAALTRHFKACAAGDFDAAMADYGPAFFQEVPRDDWQKTLTKVNEKLGTYQSHSVSGWRVFKNAGTTGSGTTVSLQCDVTYSKHPAKESFTLFRGVNDSDFKIVGHIFSAAALLSD